MPADDRAKMEQTLDQFGPEAAVLVDDDSGNSHIIARNANGDFCALRVLTHHRGQNGEMVRFRLDEESDGTQRLFHLVPMLLSLRQTGRVLVIDELDRRLHPLLSRFFVQQALDCAGADPSGQLIFTTHDTNLLDLDLLRRDEIYFVEKDAHGATQIASLAEWKIRPDLEIEKGYLNGRFGAIPFFGDARRLLCEPAPQPVIEGRRSGRRPSKSRGLNGLGKASVGAGEKVLHTATAG